MLDYYQLPEGADWQHDPKLQNIHSLRNYPDGQLQSARDACLGVRKLISDATAHALSLYQQRDHDQGFYFIGHATHTIQDSFSKAHGRRTGDDHRSLSEVCTFGREFAGICYHGIGQLPYDRVWFNTLSCALDPGVRNFDCLTDEAKSASRATAGYLYAVFLLLSGRESLVDDVLARTFDHDASNSYSGYLGCDGLH